MKKIHEYLNFFHQNFGIFVIFEEFCRIIFRIIGNFFNNFLKFTFYNKYGKEICIYFVEIGGFFVIFSNFYKMTYNLSNFLHTAKTFLLIDENFEKLLGDFSEYSTFEDEFEKIYQNFPSIEPNLCFFLL